MSPRFLEDTYKLNSSDQRKNNVNHVTFKWDKLVNLVFNKNKYFFFQN